MKDLSKFKRVLVNLISSIISLMYVVLILASFFIQKDFLGLQNAGLISIVNMSELNLYTFLGFLGFLFFATYLIDYNNFQKNLYKQSGQQVVIRLIGPVIIHYAVTFIYMCLSVIAREPIVSFIYEDYARMFIEYGYLVQVIFFLQALLVMLRRDELLSEVERSFIKRSEKLIEKIKFKEAFGRLKTNKNV